MITFVVIISSKKIIYTTDEPDYACYIWDDENTKYVNGGWIAKINEITTVTD